MGIQLPDLVENIVGKEEIARLLLMCQNEYLWSKGLTASKQFGPRSAWVKSFFGSCV